MDTLRRMLYTCLSFLLLTPNLCLVHANRSGIHTITTFPNDTWLENLAVRPNGNVLVTLIGVAGGMGDRHHEDEEQQEVGLPIP